MDGRGVDVAPAHSRPEGPFAYPFTICPFFAGAGVWMPFHIFRAFPELVRKCSGQIPEHFRNNSGKNPDFFPDFFRTISGFFRFFPEIFRTFFPDFFRIFSRSWGLDALQFADEAEMVSALIAFYKRIFKTIALPLECPDRAIRLRSGCD